MSISSSHDHFPLPDTGNFSINGDIVLLFDVLDPRNSASYAYMDRSGIDLEQTAKGLSSFLERMLLTQRTIIRNILTGLILDPLQRQAIEKCATMQPKSLEDIRAIFEAIYLLATKKDRIVPNQVIMWLSILSQSSPEGAINRTLLFSNLHAMVGTFPDNQNATWRLVARQIVANPV